MSKIQYKTPKEICEILKQSYHFEDGRVIFVINEGEENEEIFTLCGAHEFSITNEVIINIEKVNDFGLEMKDEYIEKANEVLKDVR